MKKIITPLIGIFTTLLVFAGFIVLLPRSNVDAASIPQIAYHLHCCLK